MASQQILIKRLPPVSWKDAETFLRCEALRDMFFPIISSLAFAESDEKDVFFSDPKKVYLDSFLASRLEREPIPSFRGKKPWEPRIAFTLGLGEWKLHPPFSCPSIYMDFSSGWFRKQENYPRNLSTLIITSSAAFDAFSGAALSLGDGVKWGDSLHVITKNGAEYDLDLGWISFFRADAVTSLSEARFNALGKDMEIEQIPEGLLVWTQREWMDTRNTQHVERLNFCRNRFKSYFQDLEQS